MCGVLWKMGVLQARCDAASSGAASRVSGCQRRERPWDSGVVVGLRALSKKTFLLLAKGKGRLWNWSTHNGYSLWYPRTKIFQQETVGNWTSPINKLKAEILNHGNNTK